MIARFAAPATMLALALAGCTPPDKMNEELGTDNSATAQATATASSSARATAKAGGAMDIKVDNDLYSFHYGYPAAVGAIPELAQIFDARAKKSEAELASQARQARQEARSNGFPFNTYSQDVSWSVIGRTPHWISLVAQNSSYTGGAHGIYGIDPLLWDRDAKRTVQPLSLFTSPDALYAAVKDRFCKKLDAQRAKKRGPTKGTGGGADSPSYDEFDKCPPMSDLEIELRGKGKVFDTITFYAGPYVAGPYVEGAYEVPIAVDAAVRQAVQPEFRAAFGG